MSPSHLAALLAVAVSIHCGGAGSSRPDASPDALVDALPDTPFDAPIDTPSGPLPPCTGPLTFRQSEPLPTSSPFALVTADINGDAHLDAVVGSGASENVRVFIGRGDGTFEEVPRVNIVDPNAIATGDFDDDGILDLAGVNLSGVQVALGLGAGRFEVQPRIVLGSRPTGLVAADIDHDGDLDLATLHEALDRAAVLRNNGDGTFGPGQTFPTHSTPSGLVVTDANLDGHVDLIVSNRTADAALLLGDGAGGFDAPTDLPFEISQLTIFLRDLDDNGHGDLVLTSSDTHELQVRLHDGSSGFTAPTTYDVGNQPVSVSAGDFDGDGDLDLVHLEYDVSTFTVRLAEPAGVFGSPIVFAVGGFVQPRVIVAADINHDAHTDLMVARSGSNDVGVYLAGCQQ